jgi:hypothetical protein
VDATNEAETRLGAQTLMQGTTAGTSDNWGGGDGAGTIFGAGKGQLTDCDRNRFRYYCDYRQLSLLDARADKENRRTSPHCSHWTSPNLTARATTLDSKHGSITTANDYAAVIIDIGRYISPSPST